MTTGENTTADEDARVVAGIRSSARCWRTTYQHNERHGGLEAAALAAVCFVKGGPTDEHVPRITGADRWSREALFEIARDELGLPEVN